MFYDFGIASGIIKKFPIEEYRWGISLLNFSNRNPVNKRAERNYLASIIFTDDALSRGVPAGGSCSTTVLGRNVPFFT